jgi:DNA-binding protein HU-beta
MAKAATSKKKKPLSKSEILEAVAKAVGEEVSRKQVKEVVETLVTIGHKELKQNGVFVLPGFAKFVVVKKPARPAREGINPFTKEKQTFGAKPASKSVRAMPVKAVKVAVTAEGGSVTKSAAFAEPFGDPVALPPVRFKCPTDGCPYVFRRTQVGERVPNCPIHHCTLVRVQ